MEENPLSWLCAVGESFILIRLNAVSLQRVYHIFNSIWCSLGIPLYTCGRFMAEGSASRGSPAKDVRVRTCRGFLPTWERRAVHFDQGGS